MLDLVTGHLAEETDKDHRQNMQRNPCKGTYALGNTIKRQKKEAQAYQQAHIHMDENEYTQEHVNIRERKSK